MMRGLFLNGLSSVMPLGNLPVNERVLLNDTMESAMVFIGISYLERCKDNFSLGIIVSKRWSLIIIQYFWIL